MTPRRDGTRGADLTARRQAKGWSQRQLAQAAGVGRSAVQYWEAADQLDPAGWAVRRMAEALGWHIARPFFPRNIGSKGAASNAAPCNGVLPDADTLAGAGRRSLRISIVAGPLNRRHAG